MEKIAEHAPDVGQTHDNATGEAYSALEVEMSHVLKTTMEKTGRFIYKLDDMSLSYAAGAKISERAAKREICNCFETQFGLDPLDYNKQLKEQKNEKGLQQSSKQKENDRSMER